MFLCFHLKKKIKCTYNKKKKKPLSLAILRSDVMLESDCPEACKCPHAYCCWKQVEINTIASGFGHLGPISKELQRFSCINCLFTLFYYYLFFFFFFMFMIQFFFFFIFYLYFASHFLFYLHVNHYHIIIYKMLKLFHE